ncbi:MAG: hypothetical protein FJX19_12580, partial [Alphaproteobacteria bacterium]|nr:hypothetical protein [Alphaproteobacteria bacterium]
MAGPALPDTLSAATQRTAAYDAGFPGIGYLASPRKRLQYLLLAGDLAGFTAALCAALILAGGQATAAALPVPVLAVVLGALMLAWGGIAYLAGLYDLGGTEARPRTGLPLAATVTLAAGAALLVLLAAMPARGALLAAALFAPIAGLAIFALRRALAALHAGLGRPQRVLVIVDGAQGEEIARRLRGLMAPDRVTIERISPPSGQAGARQDGAVLFPAAVAGLLQRGAYDLVAIDASSSALSRAEVEGLIGIRHRGARIVHLPSLYKAVSGKVELAAVSEEWLLHVLAARRTGGRLYARAKRL